ncbi:hypothetical protein L21SP3_01527 [Sedimentisphaera cyanobacteriorum]|uniref:Four helix bundle protein n=1 Tax=Sedimentisphaera cyanobacteriorum TaxID=1940790 RepID=A0A1Q2HQJ3_9BACT|nr:hypothetical protein L21SP3_01527 [Sedimentisphaera cyanobacteriorum]
MASGEWRVASGKWRVASGEWRVASGEWQVAAAAQAEIANELGYINNNTFESFISESNAIGKMISSLIKKILNDNR